MVQTATSPVTAPIGSDDRFPAPAYAETVLAPAFAHSQAHHLADLLRLHRAHGVMLAEQGLLTGDEIAALLAALDGTERDLAARGPGAYTGEHEDLFFFVENELKRHVGAETAGRLHTGRSRNDIDHALFKMAFRRGVDSLVARLAALVEALIARAQADAGTIILAYTHGQPAQPSTYGHYLGAVIEALLRDAERLEQARAVIDLSPMGAAAITTTGFPLDRHRMAELLGFAGILRNSYGCIASSDYTAGLFAAVKVLALDLGRVAQDMAFWTSFEVGQLRFSDGFVQISSIMPQKRNPVPVEHMRLMASLCAGRCDAVLTALHNTPFTDMNDNEHEVHGEGYAALAMAERVLTLMAAVVGSARIDEARARANIERSFATITELADTLVREERLPFVQAHHVAGDLARAMQAAGETLSNVPYATFSALFEQTAGRPPVLPEARFRHVVTPDHFVAVRTLPGGPAPAALDDSLAIYRQGAQALRAACARMARPNFARRRRWLPPSRRLELTPVASVQLQGVLKRYGQTEVVHGIDLDIADGEFIVLVGPSGCGKSTTLRMIAGLESLTEGTLRIGDRIVNTVEPKDRDIAMVFQNYALHPHMSVYRNIAFGLRAAKRPKDEIDRKVRHAAGMLGLAELLERRPHELSGGQRQRVAMGRAIVRDPQVFLFDEPLSNLDAQLRGQVRTEIKRLHQTIGTTIVYVTHDQVEAMTLADRIVIMRDGRIEQIGTPLDVFHAPATTFVAGFIGTPTMNFPELAIERTAQGAALVLGGDGGETTLVPVLPERVAALAGHERIIMGLRPDDLRVRPAHEQSGGAGVAFPGIVVIAEPLGTTTQVTVKAHGRELVGMADGRFLPAAGTEVSLFIDPAPIHLFSLDGRRLGG